MRAQDVVCKTCWERWILTEKEIWKIRVSSASWLYIYNSWTKGNFVDLWMSVILMSDPIKKKKSERHFVVGVIDVKYSFFHIHNFYNNEKLKQDFIEKAYPEKNCPFFPLSFYHLLTTFALLPEKSTTSVWFGLVLWHINRCSLFNAKSIFFYI